MAHRLISGRSKKCAVPHGHNENVRVFLRSTQKKNLDGKTNMLESFELAKKRWHNFVDNHLDHAFQCSLEDPLVEFFKTTEPSLLSRLLITFGDPTTEMLCACLMSKLTCFLRAEKIDLVCEKISIEETPTNKVVLVGEGAFAEHLPSSDADSNKTFWWERDDNSINDF